MAVLVSDQDEEPPPGTSGLNFLSFFLNKGILRKYPNLYIKEIYLALITNFER